MIGPYYQAPDLCKGQRPRVQCDAARRAEVTGSAIDDRTMRHPGYAISQWKRKLIEQLFGWLLTRRRTLHARPA